MPMLLNDDEVVAAASLRSVLCMLLASAAVRWCCESNPRRAMSCFRCVDWTMDGRTFRRGVPPNASRFRTLCKGSPRCEAAVSSFELVFYQIKSCRLLLSTRIEYKKQK